MAFLTGVFTFAVLIGVCWLTHSTALQQRNSSVLVPTVGLRAAVAAASRRPPAHTACCAPLPTHSPGIVSEEIKSKVRVLVCAYVGVCCVRKQACAAALVEACRANEPRVAPVSPLPQPSASPPLACPQLSAVRRGNIPLAISDHALVLNWNRDAPRLLRQMAAHGHGDTRALGRHERGRVGWL